MVTTITKKKQKKVLFYFGSYKHPFYNVLCEISSSVFSYTSSRNEAVNAHVAPKQMNSDSDFSLRQNIVLPLIKFFGIPKIMPVDGANFDMIHSAQYLLSTRKPYVVDFEDVSVFTWYDYRLLQNKFSIFLIKHFLASPNCVKILPWTNAAKQSLINSIDLPREITDKIQILYPAYVAKPVIDRSNRKIVKLLFVGKLFYQKGGLETIMAFIELQKKFPDLQLTMLTNAPSEILNKYGDVKNLAFLGGIDREELNNLYKESDIFVMPGHYDTFGFVYLEAMSYGLPCVGTDNFATPEIITHKKTGLIVKNSFSRFDSKFRPVVNFVGNVDLVDGFKKIESKYVDELAGAISILVKDKKMRLAFGKNSRAEIATGKFSVSERIKKLNVIFAK